MKIGVVGLGLIGGSLCKTIRKNTPYVCYGLDKDTETVDKALRDGAICARLEPDCLCEMDLTIVCLHPRQTIAFLCEHADLLRPGSIVTDVCGVKQSVVEAVEGILAQAGVRYVGAHPMAGREFSGYDYTTDSLFRGASFILTPTEASDPEAVETLRAFAIELGFGRVVLATPQEHDEEIAFTSQLAHVVSNAYVKSPRLLSQSGFSAGSFQDLTRVAKLDEHMWTDLFLMNRPALIQEIDTIIGHLSEYRAALKAEDENMLCELLRDGRILKEKSLIQAKAAQDNKEA